MNDFDPDDVRQLIIGLRGQPPQKCDFCDEKIKPEDLHPEEGGEWICIKCIERLGYGNDISD